MKNETQVLLEGTLLRQHVRGSYAVKFARGEGAVVLYGRTKHQRKCAILEDN